MARTQSSRPPVRDRILTAASRLFYQEGVQNVGIDRIIAESGVAKMSLYNHFKSKDALIAAWLQQRDQEWRTWFHARMNALSIETLSIDALSIDSIADKASESMAIQQPTQPSAQQSAQQRLLLIFDVLHEWFEQPNFRGCAFINSTVELANPGHPGSQVAIAHQQTISNYIQDLTATAGVLNPDPLTQQLMILIEGAIVVAMMQQQPNAAIQAKQAASILITTNLAEQH